MTTASPIPTSGRGRGRGRAPWLVTTLIALGVVVAGTVAVLVARPDLPDPVAIHWGPDGADGFASVTGALWLTGALTLGVTALMVGVQQLQHPSARHLLAGVAAGTGVFVAVVGYGSLLTQLGHPDAAGAPTPGLAIAVAVVLGLAIGYAVSRLTAPAAPGFSAPAGAADQAVAPGADPELLPEGARLSWVGPLPVQRLAVAIVVLAGLAPTVYLALTLDPWLWIVPVLLLALVLVLTTGTLVVDERGVRVRSVGAVTLLRVPREEVTSAGPDAVRPLREYGGWGWRLGRDGSRGLVLADGPALRIHRHGRPDVVVSVSDPEDAAAVLNTLVARGRHGAG